MHIDQNSDTRHNGIGAFVKLRISVVVVVAVAVCRLQRCGVSAHAVADGKQELESSQATRCRTWADSDNMKRIL